jgi:hypothetical protein
VPGPEDELTFVLDAVDADWEGFGDDGPFNLSDPNLEGRIAGHWRRRFGGDGAGADDGPDGYEEVPIFRLEISVSPGDCFYELLPRDEEDWISLALSEVEGGTPIHVYSGLFAPPIQAFLGANRGTLCSTLAPVRYDDLARCQSGQLGRNALSPIRSRNAGLLRYRAGLGIGAALRLLWRARLLFRYGLRLGAQCADHAGGHRFLHLCVPDDYPLPLGYRSLGGGLGPWRNACANMGGTAPDDLHDAYRICQ